MARKKAWQQLRGSLTLEQMRPLYNLQDVQLVALARCSLVGKAQVLDRNPAIQSDLGSIQKELSVASGGQGIRKSCSLRCSTTSRGSHLWESTPLTCVPILHAARGFESRRQREYFVKNLQGLESKRARSLEIRSTLADAVEVAREAENMYYTVSGKARRTRDRG